MQLLRGRTKAITELAISPDSRFVAVGSDGCAVWDLRRPQAKPVAVGRVNDAVAQLQFLAGSALVARVDLLWRRVELGGESVALESDLAPVEGNVAVDPSRGTLKVVRDSRDGRNASAIVTFPITPGGLGKPAPSVPCPHYLRLGGFAPAADRYLATHIVSDPYRGHHLYDALTDERLTTFDAPSGRTVFFNRSWRFSRDGTRVFAPNPGHLLAYDCEAGGLPVAEAALPPGADVRSLAAHPGGRILATVEDDHLVTFRDADTLAVMRTYDFAMPKLTAVAFTPDGTRCAVGNSRGKVLLFDVDD